MGYTTEFSGAISLDRRLTISEARELMSLADEADVQVVEQKTGVQSYMQWVPAESLDAIVWDGGEKFYDYIPLMRWLCEIWLKNRDVKANGEIRWAGEESGDIGFITVIDNRVTATAASANDAQKFKPLTSKTLGTMALDILTTEPN